MSCHQCGVPITSLAKISDLEKLGTRVTIATLRAHQRHDRRAPPTPGGKGLTALLRSRLFRRTHCCSARWHARRWATVPDLHVPCARNLSRRSCQMCKIVIETENVNHVHLDASSAPHPARSIHDVCHPTWRNLLRHGPLLSVILSRHASKARHAPLNPMGSVPNFCHTLGERAAVVDPERCREPWCCSGTVLQSRTAHATITTFCPQPPPSSSTYKNARRRTARALSQHFANLSSSHTKLENDTKWWASKSARAASLEGFRGTFAATSHRQLWSMTST